VVGIYHGREMKNATEFKSVSLKGSDALEDISFDGWIQLKYILNEKDMMWIGFIWFRVETSCRLL
jgi:hypothetical protein